MTTPPTTDRVGWAARWEGALCAQISGDLWFPDKGDNPHEAIAVCHRCPLQQACLDYALEAETNGLNLAGIWGGVTARNRAKLRDRKKAGKTRRHVKPCGTTAAAQRHHRAGEPLCAACAHAVAISRKRPAA